MRNGNNPPAHATLDPEDWSGVRALGHRMLDDMLDHIEHIREGPAWQPIPADVRGKFREALPVEPTSIAPIFGCC